MGRELKWLGLLKILMRIKKAMSAQRASFS